MIGLWELLGNKFFINLFRLTLVTEIILHNNLFRLQFTKITAIVNYWNFRELSAMLIFDFSDRTTKKQAMWILTFALQLSSALSIVFLWVHWVPFSASWVVRNNNNIPIALVIAQRLDKSKVFFKVDRKQPSKKFELVLFLTFSIVFVS